MDGSFKENHGALHIFAMKWSNAIRQWQKVFEFADQEVPAHSSGQMELRAIALAITYAVATYPKEKIMIRTDHQSTVDLIKQYLETYPHYHFGAQEEGENQHRRKLLRNKYKAHACKNEYDLLFEKLDEIGVNGLHHKNENDLVLFEVKWISREGDIHIKAADAASRVNNPAFTTIPDKSLQLN